MLRHTQTLEHGNGRIVMRARAIMIAAHRSAARKQATGRDRAESEWEGRHRARIGCHATDLFGATADVCI